MDNGKSRIVYAMLDTGSDRDVISEQLVKDLELPQRTKTVTIQTVEETTTDYRHFADYRLQSLDGSYRANVNEADCVSSSRALDLLGKLSRSEY